MESKEKILVCIDNHHKSTLLLRIAQKKSKQFGIDWIVVFVETSSYHRLDKHSQERILKLLTLAQQMGAETKHVVSKTVHTGITDFVKQSFETGNKIKHLILGKINKEGFLAELKASLAETIIREIRKYPTEVHIIPLANRQYTSSWFERLKLGKVRAIQIIVSLILVLAAFLISEIFHYKLNANNTAFQIQSINSFFLIASIVTAMTYGLIPALISALIGISIVDYYYMYPYNEFGIGSYADALNLSIFLFSVLLVSFLGAYSRSSKRSLINKDKRSQAIYKIHRVASESNTAQEAIVIIHEQLSDLLEMEIAFFISSSFNSSDLELTYPKTIQLSKSDQETLQLCWTKLSSTGFGTTNTNEDSKWRFEPLTTSNSEIGVIGINIPKNYELDSSFGRFFSTLSDQAASIIERIELAKMMGESHIREEREKLRSMLLSSVSHDLKTPLASIIGSLSVFKRMKLSGRLDEETSSELIDTALCESQRLDSFISNILDMTRIESGDIVFDTDWVRPEVIFSNILNRMKHKLEKRQIIFDKSSTKYLVKMDKMMTEQVMQNVVDNAIKYSPINTNINICYKVDGENKFYFSIRDNGKGIPNDKLESIFDKYERLKLLDSQVAGTGLGLAICKAVMEKQNGKIIATNHPDGGAEFKIYFSEFKIDEVDNT